MHYLTTSIQTTSLGSLDLLVQIISKEPDDVPPYHVWVEIPPMNFGWKQIHFIFIFQILQTTMQFIFETVKYT